MKNEYIYIYILTMVTLFKVSNSNPGEGAHGTLRPSSSPGNAEGCFSRVQGLGRFWAFRLWSSGAEGLELTCVGFRV